MLHGVVSQADAASRAAAMSDAVGALEVELGCVAAADAAASDAHAQLAAAADAAAALAEALGEAQAEAALLADARDRAEAQKVRPFVCVLATVNVGDFVNFPRFTADVY